MGIPIEPPEWEIGEDVPCVNELLVPLWPIGHAPRFVYASFTGINRCVAPGCDIGTIPTMNEVVKMEQQPPPNEWKWIGTTGELAAQWQACAPCLLKLAHADGVPLFYDADLPGTVWFANTLVCGVDFTCGEGGIGAVTWCPGAHKILFEYNMAYFSGIKFEFWPHSEGFIMYRFAQQQIPMNILAVWEKLAVGP